MFSKNKIQTALKEYKLEGLIPQVFTNNTSNISLFDKVAFLTLAKKAIDFEIKTLKTAIEENLQGQDKQTLYLDIKYKAGYERLDITKEGRSFVQTNHPVYTTTKQVDPSYSYKLR